MSAIWPSAVATSLQLLTAINNTKVTLNVDAGIGDTTLTVDDASPLPSSGYVTFDDNETSPETVAYTGKSGNNLTGVTRGADSTAAGTHTAGANLEMRWNAAYHNTLATEMIAVEQNLSDRFGVDSGTHVVKFVDGLVTAPSVTFASDPDCGLYRITTNDIAIATNGTKALEINATQQVILAKTANQLVFGTTNTTTISATAPASSATYTIADVGTSATFVMTAGTQTVGGAKTFSSAAIFSSTVEVDSALSITPTSNQIVLGATRTVTISAGTPATSSRTWTIPDITADGTFAALQGTQTFSGAKTFSTTLTAQDLTLTGTTGMTVTGATTNNYYSTAGTTMYFGNNRSAGGTIPNSSNTTAAMALNTPTTNANITFAVSTTANSSPTTMLTITNVALTVASTQLFLPNAQTVGTPDITFTGDPDTGISTIGANSLSLNCGGNRIMNCSTTSVRFLQNLVANSDGSGQSCGASGARWTAVWAANGTIQTSVLRTKSNVRDIEDAEIKVPKGICFQRKKYKPIEGAKHDEPQVAETNELHPPIMGFVADGLPEECFAYKDDGTRSNEDVYTGAVVGILCAAVNKLQAQVAALQTQK